MSAELKRIEAVYRARDLAFAAGKYAPERPGELYMQQRREEATLGALARRGAIDWASLRVLDVGCGRGLRLTDWLRWGVPPGHLAGIDLMPAYVAEAAARLPGADLRQGAADVLPFADGQFDVTVQAMVMSSILDAAMRRRVAAELIRVTAPGGVVLWYDMRRTRPGNADVVAIDRAEIVALFPDCDIDFTAVTLLPPLVRRLAPVSFTLCRLLEGALPPLRTHWQAVIRRRS